MVIACVSICRGYRYLVPTAVEYYQQYRAQHVPARDGGNVSRLHVGELSPEVRARGTYSSI